MEQVDIRLSLVTQIYVRNCVHVYLRTHVISMAQLIKLIKHS